jgi:sodium-dependent dicarboxylate transporter 2/3/5
LFGFSNLSLSNFLFWATQKRWFIYAIIIGLVLILLPHPSGLTKQGYTAIIILITSLVLIIKEPIPLPAIAIYMLLAQIYGGIDSADGIAKAFMNDAVFFIMGSLMLAVVIIRQGWDSRIALGILKLTGNKTSNIAFGFLFISAILSSFIGEHTVAAIMLPIGMTLIKYTSSDISKVKNLSAVILFSIAYGCLIGSVGTPSGGGRNVIMINYFNQVGVTLSYFEWMIKIYPFVLLQIPIATWVIMKTFKPEYKVLDSSVRKLVIKVARSRSMTGRNTLTVIIFFLIFIGWIFFSETFGLGTIALTGVFIYILGGFVRWNDLNRHTHWGVIILFGATISLGTSIRSTGAALWLADQVIILFGGMMEVFPFFSDLIVILITTSMANILSSSATVAVLGPITMNLVPDMLHIGLVTAVSSAFGYFTAVAAPACTIVYSSGMIKAKDFVKIGIRIGLLSIILLMIYINTYWLIIN